MRIAIVTHIGDQAAGAEHALLELLLRLPQSIEPIFFLFEDGAFANTLRKNFQSVTVLPMAGHVAKVERDRLPLSAITASLGLVGRLARALRAAAPDMVLTNSMKAHIIGSMAAKRAAIPCVNYVHDFVTGSALTLLKLVSRWCAVERLTCSSAVARNLGLDATMPIYSGIETSKFQNLPERSVARAAIGLPVDDLPVVALVGRIARWKGQDRFVRIAIDVLRDTDAHFAIIGSPLFGCDSDYVPELEAAIASAGQEHRIHFVPWQNEMRNVYGAIDLAANCSTREPFARTTLEALASGVPIICFDDAGASEILALHECGSQVPVGEEHTYAQVVRSYLHDPAHLARAQAVTKTAAARYDIAHVSRTFVNVIERVGNARAHSYARAHPLDIGRAGSDARR